MPLVALRSATLQKRLGIDPEMFAAFAEGRATSLWKEERKDVTASDSTPSATPELFASTSADDTSLGTPEDGALSFLDDKDADVEAELEMDKESESNAELAPLPTGAEARFIKLTDLLPALPSKGSFDVKQIRKSLYFFS